MKPLNLDEVRDYVNANIGSFHAARIDTLEKLKLDKLIAKNPYLLRAKNITTAGELVSGTMEAFLSSSEEDLIGHLLEDLAIFIAARTCNGHKSTAPGVDLEFFDKRIHYVVSIKSSRNWGNSSQQAKLEQDLRDAVTRVKQSTHGANVQAVLGICYGKTKTSYLRGYLKVVGQNFWYLISRNENLYIDIIRPLGYRAKEHNDQFALDKAKVINRFTNEFIERFCTPDFAIDWSKLVQFNSANFDLDKFI